MDVVLPVDAPQPRLCRMIKRPDFHGYGFNLHAEKSKPGQFIGTVDKGSPAELCGLKEGDRIVEVNGVNISQENHKQVVQRIKAIPSETKLLVVDQETEEYYRRQSIVVKSTLPNVIYLSSGERENETNNNQLIEDEDEIINYQIKQEVKENQDSPPPLPTTPPPPLDEEDHDSNSLASSSVGKKSSTVSEPSSSPRSFTPSQDDDVPKMLATRTPSSASNWAGLNLNMTAREMREMIGNKKKRDPRQDDRLDFHKKYEIIQTL